MIICVPVLAGWAAMDVDPSSMWRRLEHARITVCAAAIRDHPFHANVLVFATVSNSASSLWAIANGLIST